MAPLLAALGCLTLALAIERHWRQWLGDPPSSPAVRAVLRLAAALAFAAALMLHLDAESAGLAVLAWGCEIMAAGLSVALACGLRGRQLSSAERLERGVTSDRRGCQ